MNRPEIAGDSICREEGAMTHGSRFSQEVRERAVRTVIDPGREWLRLGAGWSEAALRRQWYSACKLVGVTVSLYVGTKHSTATELRRQGVPLDVIQLINDNYFCRYNDKELPVASP